MKTTTTTPLAQPWQPAMGEPEDGVIAIFTTYTNEPEGAYIRSDSAAAESGYGTDNASEPTGQHWYAVESPEEPSIWDDLTDDHSGLVFLVRIPLAGQYTVLTDSLEWTQQAIHRFITADGATTAEIADSYCDIAGVTPDAARLDVELAQLVASGKLRVDGGRYFDPEFDSDAPLSRTQPQKLAEELVDHPFRNDGGGCCLTCEQTYDAHTR